MQSSIVDNRSLSSYWFYLIVCVDDIITSTSQACECFIHTEKCSCYAYYEPKVFECGLGLVNDCRGIR